MIGLSSALLQCVVVRRLIIIFYSCEGDSDRQDKFDQTNILNYSRQYVE